MKKVVVFITCISFLFLLGCNKQSEKVQIKNEDTSNKNVNLVLSDFFPLKEGLVWEYEGEGNEYASFSRKVIYVDNNLAQTSEDNSGTVVSSVYKTTPNDISRIFYVGEAYEQKNYLNSTPNDNTIILKSPLKVGTSWEDTKSKREIIDINASADTPLGNFSDCIKVKITSNTTSDNSTQFEYFKKDIGMVKREFITGDIKITSSLKKFNLEKK